MASLAGLVSKRTFGAIAFAPDESAAAGPSDFARRQLEKFGWSEGDGLGKRRHGRREIVAVERKADNLGLGHASAAELLRRSVERKAAAGSDSDDSSDADAASEDPDEKVFKACGGLRLGMRAQAPQAGKLARLAAADAAFLASSGFAQPTPPRAEAAEAKLSAPAAAAADKARRKEEKKRKKREREQAQAEGAPAATADDGKARRKAQKRAATEGASSGVGESAAAAADAAAAAAAKAQRKAAKKEAKRAAAEAVAAQA